MPRDTMSVATRMSTFRFLKRSITSSRCFCSRSECMASALKPSLFSVRSSSFTFSFDEAKMMTRSGFVSRNICLRMATFCVSRQTYALCRIFSAGFETAIFTSTGSCMMVLASCTIFSGIVAEKRMVCLSLGRAFSICRMSSLKPMSSILSASSRTKNETLERSMLPILRWEMRRPGVAMMTSAPSVSPRRSCS